MTLGIIHSEVKALLARGSSMDAAIPGYVRRAGRWLEENYDLLHMRRLGEMTVLVDAQFVDAPNSRVKNIETVRLIEGDKRTNLVQVDLKEVNSYAAGTPEGYVLVNTNKIMLDCKCGTELQFELFWNEFTEWPGDLDATNWIISSAEHLLICQTLLMIGQRTRDEKLVTANKGLRDEALKVVLDSQENAKQANRNYVMKVRT